MKPTRPVISADTATGQRIMDRCDELAAFTEPGPGVTRLYLSKEHKVALDKVARWMREAGLAVHVDDAATVVGRYESLSGGGPSLMLGSHIDTVRNAGKYDGNLGVLAALAVVEELAANGTRMPFPIEVIAFGDEEGVRFPTTLAGSRALAGTFKPATLDGRDQDGISLREALVGFGCDPARIPAIGRRPTDVLGFVEVHIEQGTVLETRDLPVGAVTAISGASRLSARVLGRAGHAGTVAMPDRRDALAAAAEMITAIEGIAQASPNLVATVGSIEAHPGAVNIIAGAVRFSIDVRAIDDEARRAAVGAIEKRLRAIAAARGVGIEVARLHETDTCPCHPAIISRLMEAIDRQGYRPLSLPSGAGHDTAAVAALCPSGMLFVRCAGGISHNPDEAITATDAQAAVQVLLDFVGNLDLPSNH